MPTTDSGASPLAPLLDGSTAEELIPELVRQGLQQLIELEVAAVLGAERYERTEERLSYRNGSRPRMLTTQVGDIPLSIPKLRARGFFPSFFEKSSKWSISLMRSSGTCPSGSPARVGRRGFAAY
jgi:transposase-like protein